MCSNAIELRELIREVSQLKWVWTDLSALLSGFLDKGCDPILASRGICARRTDDLISNVFENIDVLHVERNSFINS